MLRHSGWVTLEDWRSQWTGLSCLYSETWGWISDDLEFFQIGWISNIAILWRTSAPSHVQSYSWKLLSLAGKLVTDSNDWIFQQDNVAENSKWRTTTTKKHCKFIWICPTGIGCCDSRTCPKLVKSCRQKVGEGWRPAFQAAPLPHLLRSAIWEWSSTPHSLFGSTSNLSLNPLFTTLRTSPVKQANVPCHMARSVQAKMENQNIQSHALAHSPPDLNPMEKLWKIKLKMEKHKSKTFQIYLNLSNSKRLLWQQSLSEAVGL